MPKYEISKQDLEKMVGKKLTKEQIEDLLLFAKTELDAMEGDTLKVDVKDTNRPDLWSVEGIARELKGHLGKEEGLPSYTVKKAQWKVHIESGTVQPLATAAVIRGVRMGKDVLSQMIQLQEKVSLTFGRNRKSLSLGAYDMRTIEFPLAYNAMKPENIRFKPLGFTQVLLAKDILQQHPKGKQFGHLLAEAKEFPVWQDAKGSILSMPPIINSEECGKVTVETEDVFIECTGYTLKHLQTAINVLATALAERGGQIEQVEMVRKGERFLSPNLIPKKAQMDPDYCRKILGLDMSEAEIIALLKKSRYHAKYEKKMISVEYPAYRSDIMHQRDIVEDVAISYGYNNMKPQSPMIPTQGSAEKKEEFCNIVREICVGLGMQEILTFILTQKESMFQKMNLPEGKIVEIENPMSSNWAVFRNWLLPHLLQFLSVNKNQEYPQSIFEIGDSVSIDPSEKETGTRNKKKLAIALTHSQVGYEEISSQVVAMLSSLGHAPSLKKINHPSFIAGRVAEIHIQGKSVGIVGEIHPQVLNNWGLEKPVAAAEIDSELLMEMEGSK